MSLDTDVEMSNKSTHRWLGLCDEHFFKAVTISAKWRPVDIRGNVCVSSHVHPLFLSISFVVTTDSRWNCNYWMSSDITVSQAIRFKRIFELVKFPFNLRNTCSDTVTLCGHSADPIMRWWKNDSTFFSAQYFSLWLWSLALSVF